MRTALLLAVVIFSFLLPPVSALNCTLFSGESWQLCAILNSLPMDEEHREILVNSNAYGTIEDRSPELPMKINLSQEEDITLNEIYEEKLLPLWIISLLLMFTYLFYAFAKSSSNLSKWLNVVY